MGAVLFGENTLSRRLAKRVKNVDNQVFGSKVGVIAKVFGCWHENISRPFVEGKTAYRSCLKCGARRQFDSDNLTTHGSFYYPPLVRQLENI